MRQAKSDVFQIDPESKEEHDQAALVAEGHTPLLMRTPDGSLAPLPAELGRVVVVAAASLASGHAVVVAESAATVTTTKAAEMLGVSRPMVTRWIAEGMLPDVPVGSHHRIPVSSVVSLRDARTQAGYRAMEVMRAGDEVKAGGRTSAARERARKRISARPSA